MNKFEWLSHIEEIVFSGGGVKILSMCGALFVLENGCGLNWRQQIKHVCGTSGGGFLALLVCLGYQAHEILHFMLELPGHKLSQSLDLSNCHKKWGLFNHSFLTSMVHQVFERKSISPQCTFRQLFEQTQCLFSVAVTVVNTNRCEYHNALLTPDYPVIRSLIASMSIPLVFQPVVVPSVSVPVVSGWASPSVDKPDKPVDYYWVDGGLIENVPFQSCDLHKCLIFFCDSNQSLEVQGLKDYVSRVLLLAPNVLQQQQVNQIPNRLLKHKLCFFMHDIPTLPVHDLLNPVKQTQLFWRVFALGVIQTLGHLFLSTLLE